MRQEVRYRFEADLPSAARRFVDPEQLTWVEVGEHDLADLQHVAAAGDVEGTLAALGQLLRNIAPLLLMCDPRDLQLSVQVKSPHTGLPTIFLWETIPGGVGLSEHLFTETSRLLAMARELAPFADAPSLARVSRWKHLI